MLFLRRTMQLFTVPEMIFKGRLRSLAKAQARIALVVHCNCPSSIVSRYNDSLVEHMRFSPF